MKVVTTDPLQAHHELLDRITQNEPIAAEEARERIENCFRQAEALLSEKHHREGWELAK